MSNDASSITPCHLEDNQCSTIKSISETRITQEAMPTVDTTRTALHKMSICHSEVKRVRFSNVNIRRHDVTCTGFINQGPGIGLDWFWTDEDPKSLVAYEQSRPAARRSEKMLVLSARERKTLLLQKHEYDPSTLHRICNSRISGGIRRTPHTARSQPRTPVTASSVSPALQRLAPAFRQGEMLKSATKMFSRVSC